MQHVEVPGIRVGSTGATRSDSNASGTDRFTGLGLRLHKFRILLKSPER